MRKSPGSLSLIHKTTSEDANKLRFIGAVVIGVLIAICVFIAWNRSTNLHPDLYQPWLGAQLLRAGEDPYKVVGPGLQYPHEFHFYYPLTASIIVLPLSFFPIAMATGLFSGVSSGFLAYKLEPWRYPVFLSVPFLSAAWAGQWSIVFTAAFIAPALGFVLVAKPTVGLAYFRPRLSACVTGLAIIAVSFLFLRDWPLEWMQSVSHVTGMKPPLLYPFGFVSLFALVKWRDPKARLIVLLSLVPQTHLWYEALPLQLVARNVKEAVTLALLSSLPVFWEIWFGLKDGTFDVYPNDWHLAIFAYLPAVLIVLSADKKFPK